MKKALALVLALVLALSMAVSAFAVDFVVLEEDKAETAEIEKITVVEIDEAETPILYTTAGIDPETVNFTYGTEYYIALDPAVKYKDVEVTANGNIDAELVKFDPETMSVDGVLELTYSVTKAGENVGVNAGTETEPKYNVGGYTANGKIDSVTDAYWKTLEADEGKSGYPDFRDGWIPTSGLSYKEAKLVAAFLAKYDRVTTYSVECEQYVNIIKLTVEDNFTAHYTEGTLKIKAYDVVEEETVVGELKVLNDVIIFEYEDVKYAAANFEKGAALQLGALGYSDAFTAENGYSWNAFDGYDPEENRVELGALVVSTTAFRAIEGEDLKLNIAAYDKTWMPKELKGLDINVVLKDIAAGQKGVNFFAWVGTEGLEIEFDEDGEVVDYDRYPSAITFGFLGDQVVKGEFEITVALPIDWYELRELFGLKVEEDDIISYYIVDENGKVVGGKEIDYMTADITENVEFTVAGKNQKLGEYTLCLEVPAAEEGEANPNTGAESVVGVVAALAVVSVATAAAVSLKK